MRIIDDGVVDVIAGASTRGVRVGCAGELLPVVVASLAELATDLAPVIAAVDEPDDGNVIAALQRGLVDIAVVASTAEAEGLVVRRVAGLSRGVFVAAAAATTSPVYAVPIDRDGAPRDGFPARVPRAIGLRARQGAAVLEAVRSAGLAAVLPHAVGRRAGFVAVDVGVELARLELSLATRAPLAPDDPVERVAARLIAALTVTA